MNENQKWVRKEKNSSRVIHLEKINEFCWEINGVHCQPIESLNNPYDSDYIQYNFFAGWKKSLSVFYNKFTREVDNVFYYDKTLSVDYPTISYRQ